MTVGGPVPYATVMQRVVHGEDKSFVVFEHGTIVVFVKAAPDRDLRADAAELMKKYGPVSVGSPSGDFSVIELRNGLGWAVTSHHPDIFTLVLPEEVSTAESDLSIGLVGRAKRADDAERLTVVHVKDAR